MVTKPPFETSVNNQLQSMDDRLCKMETNINSINEKMNQVVSAILGNPLTKQGGFLEEIELLKKEIEMLKDKTDKQDEFKKRFTWTIGIIVTLALILQWIANVVLNLVGK